MTKRLPVSNVQNVWADAQRVDKADLDIEQSFVNNTTAAIVNNFFGSGVLLNTPLPNIIFDSNIPDATAAALIAAGNFDGTGISATAQPSDVVLGNQLTIELSESNAFGRLGVMVAIIGLSFDDQLQYDTFYFYNNGKQTTSKHYKRILTLLFNNFLGNNLCSRDLGGRIVIRETLPFELSIDPIMISQDVMPNIFFRDFKVANPSDNIYTVVQTGIGPDFNADSLNINITGKQPHRTIAPNDVTTRIGQKFLTRTNNIQKITLLLGVEEDTAVAAQDRFNWSGNLIISLSKLQNSVDCPTDIVPNLAIEYDPNPVPLIEVSFSQNELLASGYVLTNVAQPIDFVFTNAKVAQSGGITEDEYYIVAYRRSGDTSVGTIFSESGTNQIDDARLSIFSNDTWIDAPDEDLWFQVWTDAAKVADGSGYDSGNGIVFEKVITDPTTGTDIDNQERYFSFTNTGSNTLNVGVLQASIKESLTVQDERTGDNVFSRKQYVPSVSFVTESGLLNLQTAGEPLIIGAVNDQNPKTNIAITGQIQYTGQAGTDSLILINPSPDLLSQNLIGRVLIPEQTCTAFNYKIFKSTYCQDGYGDVNGDGVIDQDDIDRASDLSVLLAGYGIDSAEVGQKILDGYCSILELLRADVNGDGYVTSVDVDLIQSYVNKDINSFPVGTYFTHVELKVQNTVGRYDGYYDCNGNVLIDGYGGGVYPPDSFTSYDELFYGNLIPPSIVGDNPEFSILPFIPVQYQISFVPFWQSYLIGLKSNAREVAQTFTENRSLPQAVCEPRNEFGCEDRTINEVNVDPGRNDFYVPNDLIIGKGQLKRIDGTLFKQDIEIGTIVLEFPQEDPFTENTLNIFNTFVAESGDGVTSARYPAMKYSDCSFVQLEDLILGRVKFSVSIQSFVPNIDGYSLEDGYGAIVDDLIGVYLDHSTGILKLTAKDLVADTIFKSLVTRIQIQIFLKKAGWLNPVRVISPAELSGLIV